MTSAVIEGRYMELARECPGICVPVGRFNILILSHFKEVYVSLAECVMYLQSVIVSSRSKESTKNCLPPGQ